MSVRRPKVTRMTRHLCTSPLLSFETCMPSRALRILRSLNRLARLETASISATFDEKLGEVNTLKGFFFASYQQGNLWGITGPVLRSSIHSSFFLEKLCTD